jgi:hypothetical protein
MSSETWEAVRFGAGCEAREKVAALGTSVDREGAATESVNRPGKKSGGGMMRGPS